MSLLINGNIVTPNGASLLFKKKNNEGVPEAAYTAYDIIFIDDEEEGIIADEIIYSNDSGNIPSDADITIQNAVDYLAVNKVDKNYVDEQITARVTAAIGGSY